MSSIPNDTTILDSSVLLQLEETFGAECSLRELVSLFLEDGAVRVARAREGQRTGNIDAVTRAVHSLKGSASMIGAHRLRLVAAELEERLAAKDVGSLADDVETLEQEFTRLRTVLEELADSRQAS